MDVVETSWAGVRFMHVPEGDFLMGSTVEDSLAESDERPQHTVSLEYGYWVARTPVTNGEFAEFVTATGHVSSADKEDWAFVFDPAAEQWGKVPGASWRHPTGPSSDAAELAGHPVVCVGWHDARAYCAWLNETQGAALPSGYRFRLPSEAEWEKAARGPDGPVFPWGDGFDPRFCNHFGSAERATIPVGTLPREGESVYGVADMSGNTWDWTKTLWGADRDQPQFTYPYDATDGREDTSAGDEVYRVIRGGSWKNESGACRSACRDVDPPGWSLNNLGFRVFVGPVHGKGTRTET